MVGTSNASDKTPDASLDLAEIVRLRGSAFIELGHRADEITAIASGIEDLDICLQTNTAGRSVDRSSTESCHRRSSVGGVDREVAVGKGRLISITTPAAGRRAADAAISGHEARRRRFLLQAKRWFVELLGETEDLTTDDLRARWPELAHIHSEMGAIPKALVRAGVIRCVGWREASRESSNSRPLRVWRLVRGCACITSENFGSDRVVPTGCRVMEALF